MSRLESAPKLIIILIIPLLFLFGMVLLSSPVYSGEVDQIQDQIDQKTNELNQQKSVLGNIEKKISDISNSKLTIAEKIAAINKEITTMQIQIDEKDVEIQKKLTEISEKQSLLDSKKTLLDSISSDLYMQTRYDSGQFIFSGDNFDRLLRNIFMKSSTISSLRGEIESLNGEFTNLAEIKTTLEKEKGDLDFQKKDLDASYALLAAEKAKLQKELNSQLAAKSTVSRKINGLSTELSDLQYQLLIARQGGTNVNLDSVPVSGDYKSTLAGFRAQAPAGSFAVFSIGAYTHRNGMSQWGAKARALAGQSYTEILSAYYPGKNIRTGTVVVGGVSSGIMTNISTTTYGVMNFEEDYLLRLGEMSETWPMEVLKAQAIIARTYAINYTRNGSKSICTNESCQVVLANEKTGNWKTAVESTRGMVLTDGSGAVFSAQYAAVHGGWINNVGWDTTDKSGSGDWMSRAWDSKSGVSWFYKAWYHSGYSETSSTCGRNPWLSNTEMSDILNVYQVWKSHGMNDSRIYPVHDACHSDGNPYSFAEAKSLSAKPVSQIYSSVTHSSNGTTTSIDFSTDAGVISVSGNDFKTIFNLRAPGYLRIPQSSFVHINVEKK